MSSTIRSQMENYTSFLLIIIISTVVVLGFIFYKSKGNKKSFNIKILNHRKSSNNSEFNLIELQLIVENKIAEGLKIQKEQIYYKEIPIVGYGKIVMGIVKGSSDIITTEFGVILQRGLQEAATIRLRINGANSNNCISIPAMNTGVFKDTSNVDSFSTEDYFAVSIEKGGRQEIIFGPVNGSDLIKI